MSAPPMRNKGSASERAVEPEPRELNLSELELYGGQVSSCGYCGTKSSSRSFAVLMRNMSVEDYEAMVYSGWRRSGQHLYRPDLHKSCCQLYVIRLHADSYVPSSSQKRVLKRLRRASRASTETTADIASGQRTCGVLSESLAATPPSTPQSVPVPRLSECDLVCPLIRRTILSALRLISFSKAACVEENEALSLKIDASDVDAACSSIRVTPRIQRSRVASKKRKRTASDATESSGQSDPFHHADASMPSDNTTLKHDSSIRADDSLIEVASNAAMVLASVERKRQRIKGRDPAVNAARAMEIASTLTSILRCDSIFRGKVVSVECAQPGFVNIRLTSRQACSLVQNVAGVEDSGSDETHMETSRASCMTDSGPVFDKASRSGASASAGSPVCALNGERRTGHVESRALGSNAPARDAASARDVFEEGEKTPHRSPDDEKSVAPGTNLTSSGDYEGDDSTGDSSSEEESGRNGLRVDKVDLSPVPGGRKFSMEMQESSFLRDEYELFRLYQMTAHKSRPSECTEESYRRFLVDTPMSTVHRDGGPPTGYGSFHVRYCLDNRLFAVGVVDILPHCLSSVYLFFDPAYAALSPGVLSAIKEIEWVQRISRSCPDLDHYVMGYYVHTCPKMKYKAAFKPSEILCEETRRWVPATRACAVLDAAYQTGVRTVRLAPEGVDASPAREAHDVGSERLHQLVSCTRVHLVGQGRLSFGKLERLCGDTHSNVMRAIRREIGQFISLVGRGLHERFLFRFR